MDRAHERGVVLKMAKSWLGHTNANFFGYEVSHGKYKLGKERKDNIQKMQLPTKTKDMQSFLRLCNEFRRVCIETPRYDS